MQREEQRGGGGAEAEGQSIVVRGRGEAEREEMNGHGIDQHRVGGVEYEGGQMIARGVHAPERVIQAQGQPRHRDVVPHVDGGEHPPELGRAQAAIVRVAQEVVGVVPVEEAGAERGHEGSQSAREDQDGKASCESAHDDPILTLLTLPAPGVKIPPSWP